MSMQHILDVDDEAEERGGGRVDSSLTDSSPETNSFWHMIIDNHDAGFDALRRVCQYAVQMRASVSDVTWFMHTRKSRMDQSPRRNASSLRKQMKTKNEDEERE